jgi:hypothetical protein
VNVIESSEHRFPIAMLAIALPLGAVLLFLLHELEGILHAPMAVNAMLEETTKIALFLLTALAARSRFWSSILFPAVPDPGSERSTRLLVPILCITAFGLAENLLYFFNFPTSSIYQRLLYSYPIHLNTALLYALAFLSGRPLKVAGYFAVGVLYHLSLNYLSLRLPEFAVYLVGGANLLILFLLYWRMRVGIIERSIQTCWNPK